MSPTAAVPSSTEGAETARVSCFEGSVPGKVFLLGEYAVLSGLPALVAAVGPRFRLRAWSEGQGPGASERVPAPASPAGRLRARAEATGRAPLRYAFEDPYEGRGGFGGSTAEFALAYRAWRGGEATWRDAWRLYRELTGGGPGAPPSGADLVAQWRGGVTLFEPASERCEDLAASVPGGGILVFSAAGQEGRKVATHEHLAAIASSNGVFERGLGPALERGIAAARSGDLAGLGRALDDYADALSRAGLECRATAEDRAALRALPAVLGAKGAGAMQADALVVATAAGRGSPERTRILDVALARGLELVADGLKATEEGIR